ncbi:glycosyltransferase family protein [Dactylosporangium cerinum]
MRRAFLIAFVGFFLLGAAWALALPVNGTYDEKQHLVRAWAVWTGQWLPHDRALDASGIETNAFTGPRSLVPANADCTHIDKPAYKPASCLTPTADRTETLVPSAAARYSPVYYALVGLPLRISPDGTGLIWARLLSAALSALLLAAAFTLAGSGLLRVAVVLAATPMVMNLDGALNPNGMEISAAVLLYVAVLRRHWAAAGVSAALLLTIRDLGPFFAAAVLAVSLFVTGTWIRSRVFWLPFAGGAAFAVFWSLFASRDQAVDPGRPIAATTSGAILRDIADNRAEFWVRQIIGQFGYGETQVSIGLVGLWYLLAAALVVPALWFGTTRLRIAIVAVGVTSAVMLLALELYFAPKVGHFAHGRYVMPLGVGVVLLAGTADRYAAWLSARGWLDRLAVVLVAVTVPLDLYALARVMTRFQRGISAGLNPFGGRGSRRSAAPSRFWRVW